MNDAVASPSLTQRLAEFAGGLRHDAIPPAVLRASRRLLLDTLAVGWAGTSADGMQGIADVLLQQAGGSPPADRGSVLWRTGATASPLDAAFLNGGWAAALDYDALHIEAPIHTSIVTVPSLLALGQSLHVSGRTLLEALVAADEINCRIGLSAGAHTGWFYTSVFGVFGAAAGCARLLGLGTAGLTHAMGTALFQAGGTQQSMVEKALTKRYMSALAARAGLFSALLAQGGMVAPLQALEGAFGLFRMYERGDEAVLLEGLGERFHCADISFKKYPSCGCAHAITEATLRLVETHRLNPDDVAGATARISSYMHRLIGSPFDPTPANASVTAQFSAPYAVACALHRGRFGIDDLQADQVLDPRVGAFARRVAVEIDPSNIGQLEPSEVEFEMRSGARLVQRVDHFPGGTATTMPDRDLQAKVRDCISHGARPLAGDRIDRFIDRVLHIDQMPDVADLFDDL